MLLACIIGFVIFVIVIVNLVERINKIPIEIAERKRVEALDAEARQQKLELELARSRFETLKCEAIAGIHLMSSEKAQGFPWLAHAYSEYFKLFDLQLADALENKKSPARKAAEQVRQIAREKAALKRENKILRELHRYYEALFPWLIDFKGEDLDDLIQQVQQPPVRTSDTEEVDPALNWLTDAEYGATNLTRVAKFQRALDRYWRTRKAPWQVGRDYERFIGYIHETYGFNVIYHGIEERLQDLGRDLICKRGDEVRIVQCKNWREGNLIHEKDVCQLYGSSIAYAKGVSSVPETVGKKVSAWLFTTHTVSPTAQEFAKSLNVGLLVQTMGLYPAIKCNVSQRDGAKIYHLPFDQQYDRTLIEHRDECYLETVEDAERLGFRRAFRWKNLA